MSGDAYTSPWLTDLWGRGHTYIAPVNMASICYVVGYTQKKISDDETFCLMSRRPGIGFDWSRRFGEDVRRTGHVVIEGRRMEIPRQYLDKDPEFFASTLKARKAFARSRLRSSMSLAFREI